MNYGIQEDAEEEVEIPEEDRAELDEFRGHLPQDMASNVEQQRAFSD